MCSVKMDSKLRTSQAKTSEKFLFLLGVLLALINDDFFVEGSRSGCNVPLGMEDGRIKNWQLTAQSYDSGYYARNGRLNGEGAWCSHSQEEWKEYFQIRLDRVRHVSGVGTQGLKNTGLTGLFPNMYWVKRYAIEYSYDGLNWYWYKDIGSNFVKLFIGNTDATSERRNKFRDTFVTKLLRIYPLDYKKDMCLRVEVYGCPNDKDCTTYLTEPSGVFSSPNYPLNYPLGIDCTWIINLSNKYNEIALFFKYMDVNNGASVLHCSGDYVVAHNGLKDISNFLGEFCNGEDTPIIKSNGNSMFLRFHSNSNSIARQGFQMAYYSFTRGTDDVYRTVACTNSSLSIDCSSSSSKSIKILHVSYGTLPFSTNCGSKGHNSSCQASGVGHTVTTLCENLKVCTIDVAGPLFNLIDCQAGSVPRLDVYYQCTGTVIRTLPPTTTTTPLPPSTTTPLPPSTTTPLPPSTTTPHPTTHNITLPTDGTTPSTLPARTIPQTEPTTTSAIVPVGGSPSTQTVSTTGKEAGDKFARASSKDNPGMLIGIIVAVIVIVIVVAVVVGCFMYRRRRKPKDKLPRTVMYTATGNTGEAMPSFSRGGRGSSRKNPYETVNVLYVSADDARYKDQEMEHIYDSPDLHEPLPQMTNNPLYHGGLELDTCYESIDSQSLSDAKVPLSLDPAIYDSPLPVAEQKSATTKSISNPNYDKTIQIPDK